MKILYLSPRKAWPAVTGAKLRDFFLARALGLENELTWVFYQAPDEEPVSAKDVPFCRCLIPVPRPALYTTAKLIKGMIGKWSFPVVNYTSPEMIAAVRDLPDLGSFDAVHVDSIHMAACVDAIRPQLGKARIFYNWHNIESELMRRYSQSSKSWLRGMYARYTASRMERDEAHILDTADGHVVCSERERKKLQELAPKQHIAVVENGVDAAAFAQAGQTGDSRNRRRIVFVGSMSYHANADGAEWFATEVWPSVHQRFPEWTLTLVGSNPGPAVRALGNLRGVEVTGTVPDVRPYYREAVAAVVPLRIGGGTRLKILEALAAGVPVVSTAEGAEGLAVEPGREFLLASEPGHWLPLLESLRNSDRAARLVAAGQELIQHRYDWATIGKMLVATYQQWLTQ